MRFFRSFAPALAAFALCGGISSVSAQSFNDTQRGDIEAIHVRNGRKKGLRLRLNCSQPNLFNQIS